MILCLPYVKPSRYLNDKGTNQTVWEITYKKNEDKPFKGEFLNNFKALFNSKKEKSVNIRNNLDHVEFPIRSRDGQPGKFLSNRGST